MDSEWNIFIHVLSTAEYTVEWLPDYLFSLITCVQLVYAFIYTTIQRRPISKVWNKQMTRSQTGG